MGQHASQPTRTGLSAKRNRRSFQGAGGEQDQQQQPQQNRQQQPQQNRQQNRQRPHPQPQQCRVCFEPLRASNITTLPCQGKHKYCKSCWRSWRESNRPNLGTCPTCRQTIPLAFDMRNMLELWTASTDTAGWPDGQALISRLQADENPAGASAIVVLRGLTRAEMYHMDLAHLAYQIAYRIFSNEGLLPDPQRDEVRRWMHREDPAFCRSTVIGFNLARGRSVSDGWALRLLPSPAGMNLARQVLEPLTRDVLLRVYAIIHSGPPIDMTVLETWPSISDPVGEELISLLQADENPAVARAICALHGLTLSEMFSWNLSNLAYEMVTRIFFNEDFPPSPALHEVRIWINSVGFETLGTNLVRGHAILDRTTHLSPAGIELVQAVLAPLTPGVIRRVYDLINSEWLRHGYGLWSRR